MICVLNISSRTFEANLSPLLVVDWAVHQHYHPNSSLPPIYDLVGVSNHHGTLNGGHYIAHVDTTFGGTQGSDTPRWVCFNDSRVSNANSNNIVGPTAYVLFYKLREDT